MYRICDLGKRNYYSNDPKTDYGIGDHYIGSIDGHWGQVKKVMCGYMILILLDTPGGDRM